MSNEPVIVELHVEGFGESADETVKIDRAEWDAMSPAEREEMLNDYADTFATNHVNWGWYIPNEADGAEAGQP